MHQPIDATHDQHDANDKCTDTACRRELEDGAIALFTLEAAVHMMTTFRDIGIVYSDGVEHSQKKKKKKKNINHKNKETLVLVA